MTIDLRKYATFVYVDLNPGIYVFDDESAVGKTYLCSLLRKFRLRERVDSHSYPDDFRPMEFFDRSKRDLVMLDRYDMYAGQGEKEMLEFAKSGVVLIDCKSSKYNMAFNPCSIRMDKMGVTVYDPLSD